MTQAQATQQTGLLSRLTVKTVFGDIDKEIVKKAKKLHLMRVYGQANGFKVATSQYGDSIGFIGQFKAANPETGEMYRSGKCFLPKVVENLLAGALQGENTEGVEFAFDLFAVPGDNAFGYEYRVETVVEVAESPVLASLEAKMLSLPAPKAGKKAA